MELFHLKMEAKSVSQRCLIPQPFSWKLFSSDYFISLAVASCYPHASVLMVKPPLIPEDHATGKEYNYEFSEPLSLLPSSFSHRPDTVMILLFQWGTTNGCQVDSVREDTIWISSNTGPIFVRTVLFVTIPRTFPRLSPALYIFH